MPPPLRHHLLPQQLASVSCCASGNRPEELPEQVLAAARVYRCDFDNARPFPARSLDELGNGTGPQHDGEAMRT